MVKTALAFASTMLLVACGATNYSRPPPPPPPPAPAENVPIDERWNGPSQIFLPNEIEFALDSARIRQTPETLESLNKLVAVLKQHPNITKLRIEGHTDATGTIRHNDKLSVARAESVARWLIEHQIDGARLKTNGVGPRRPLVANDTPEHRALNRRTEYHVEEIDGKRVEWKE